jgi:hypothetical protein
LRKKSTTSISSICTHQQQRMHNKASGIVLKAAALAVQ